MGLQLTNYTDNDTKLNKHTTIMAISGDCQIRLASDAVVDQSDEMQLRPSGGDERPDIIHSVNKYKYKYKCISYKKKGGCNMPTKERKMQNIKRCLAAKMQNWEDVSMVGGQLTIFFSNRHLDYI